MKKILAIATIITLFSFSGFGQSYRLDTTSVSIGFRRGVSMIEKDYSNNEQSLKQMIDKINAINSDTSTIIHSININTAASPEGAKRTNDQLSRARAKSILNYLMDNTTLSPSQIKMNSRGENWVELNRFLRNSCTESWKNAALAIIDNTKVLSSDDESTVEDCKAQLRTLENGKAWNWMDENVFPMLRNAGGRINLISSPVSVYNGMSRDEILSMIKNEMSIKKDTVYLSMTYIPVNLNDIEKRKPNFKMDSLLRKPVLAFRSNLLLPLLNVGLEIPVGNRSSVGMDYYYPWVPRPLMNTFCPSQKNCFQTLGISLEYRIWFGKIHSKEADPKYRLRGHSIGISAVGGYYDVEADWKGEQGEIYGLSADYRYALPLGKGGCHFEFYAGAGYATNVYRNYDVKYEGGKLVGNKINNIRHIVFPRLGFSIVIPVFGKEDLK